MNAKVMVENFLAEGVELGRMKIVDGLEIWTDCKSLINAEDVAAYQAEQNRLFNMLYTGLGLDQDLPSEFETEEEANDFDVGEPDDPFRTQYTLQDEEPSETVTAPPAADVSASGGAVSVDDSKGPA